MWAAVGLGDLGACGSSHCAWIGAGSLSSPGGAPGSECGDGLGKHLVLLFHPVEVSPSCGPAEGGGCSQWLP